MCSESSVCRGAGEIGFFVATGPSSYEDMSTVQHSNKYSVSTCLLVTEKLASTSE